MGSCTNFSIFFLFFLQAYSHSPGPNESTGTKILQNFYQKIGQTDSLRIWFIYYIYTNKILRESFWPTFWWIFLKIFWYQLIRKTLKNGNTLEKKIKKIEKFLHDPLYNRVLSFCSTFKTNDFTYIFANLSGSVTCIEIEWSNRGIENYR